MQHSLPSDHPLSVLLYEVTIYSGALDDMHAACESCFARQPLPLTPAVFEVVIYDTSEKPEPVSVRRIIHVCRACVDVEVLRLAGMGMSAGLDERQ
jgi:hypothetical protein